MADDRMKNDDLQRNMGTSGKEGQEGHGMHTPGHQQDGQQGGQNLGGQQGYGGSQHKEPRNMEDDEEFGGGTAGKTGGMNRGGQNS